MSDEQFDAALTRFRRCRDAWSKQRERDRENLRFQIPELQWSEEARRERSGGITSGVAQPPRPMLSVSKLDQPIRMIENQMRNAKLGVQIHPLTPDANDETAEILQDLYRAIERDSRANQARAWAFSRAVRTGWGVYRILTTYNEDAEDDTPEAWDQDVRIERILHQDSVYFDPASTKADFSDAQYLFCGQWMRVKDFEREFPGKEISTSDDLIDEEYDPDWVQELDGEPQAVYVAEYWFKEVDRYEIEMNGQKRSRERVKVYCRKMTAGGWLEEPQEWSGKLFPFVVVVGRELQPVDGERRWDGIIGPNKDPQRAFNYALTGAVEAAALEPKAPFVGDPRQIEGYEELWQQVNNRNMSFLPAHALVVGGSVIPPPQRVQVDGSRMQVNLALSQSLEQALQSGTMQFDPSLGRSSGSERSGKAIQALQQQGIEATSDFLANYADDSLTYEAAVILDLIPTIYDRPGRIARVLDEEENTQTVVLGTPFIVDKETGQVRLVQIQPGQTPPPGMKFYDLSKGRYGVSVSIGRSRQSRLEAGTEQMEQILTARPELMPVIGDLFFRWSDFPGAKEIAERLAKLREKQFPGIGADDDEQGMTPEMARAQMEQMQQQLQMVTAQLQQAMSEIQTEQAKQQAQLVKADMDNRTRVQVAEIKAESDQRIAQLRAQLELLEKRLGAREEDRQADKDVTRDITRSAAEAVLKPPKMDPFAGSVGRPLTVDKGEV